MWLSQNRSDYTTMSDLISRLDIKNQLTFISETMSISGHIHVNLFQDLTQNVVLDLLLFDVYLKLS